MKTSSKANNISHLSFLTKSLLGTVFIFACAQVQIPLEPVPITLHTAGVLIIALIYKKSEALTSIGSYIFLGAMGLPVFSGLSSGSLLGATGGYVFGMFLCMYIVTTLREKYGDDSIYKLLSYSFIGSVAIYALGLPWLSYLVGFDKSIQLGLLPFIIPGIVKAFFVASTVRLFKSK